MSKISSEAKDFANLSLGEKIIILNIVLKGSEKECFNLSTSDERLEGLLNEDNIENIRKDTSTKDVYYVKRKGISKELKVEILMTSPGGSRNVYNYYLVINGNDNGWDDLTFSKDGLLQKTFSINGKGQVCFSSGNIKSGFLGSDGVWKHDGIFNFQDKIHIFNDGKIFYPTKEEASNEDYLKEVEAYFKKKFGRITLVEEKREEISTQLKLMKKENSEFEKSFSED